MDVKLFKSRKIILDMLEMRDYDVSELRNYSINEIRLMKENSGLNFLLTKEGRKCYVHYHIEKKLRANDLTKAIENRFIKEESAELEEGDELIIICKEKLLISKKYGNFSSKLNNYYNNYNFFVQIFNINSLQYNLMEHELVPEHIILNEHEKKDVLKYYNLTADKMPCISRFDPVAKFIGLRPKQMCKIIRNSYTAGKTNYYRVCI